MSKQMLLADDSITIQKVIALTFAGEDYAITAVNNGADAIAKAKEARPDIILADASMPQKNGYEVAQAIKGDPSLASVPVLLLVGTFEPFDENDAKKAGVDGYIIKPFESQALIQKVRELTSAVAEKSVEAPIPVQEAVTAEPIVPPVSPVVPPAAEAPAKTEEDFWGGIMEEVETKAAPQETAPVQTEAPGDQLWDMGEFEEEVPVEKKAKEEDLWESFAFEDTEAGEAKEELIAAPVVEEEHSEEEFTFVSEEIPIGEGLTPPAEEMPAEEPVLNIEVEAPVMEAPAAAELEEAAFVEPAEEHIEVVEEEPFFAAPEEESIPVVEAPEAPIEVVAEPFLPEEPQHDIFAGYEQTFEPEAISMEAPVTPPAEEPAISVVPTVPIAPAAAGGVSEEQLRAMLSQVSREVIEKIVWEVVPDLAEMLIKEEIKRLQGK